MAGAVSQGGRDGVDVKEVLESGRGRGRRIVKDLVDRCSSLRTLAFVLNEVGTPWRDLSKEVA